jgi:hypothetical protein
MAETYEQYLKKTAATTDPTGEASRWMSVEDRMGAAMDLTELLQQVRLRVEAFIERYEAEIADTMEFIAEQRAKGTSLSVRTADLAELDIQAVAALSNPAEGKTRLTLDDLKILLQKFPQNFV